MKTINDDNIAEIVLGVLKKTLVNVANVSSFIVKQGEQIANIAINTKKEK